MPSTLLSSKPHWTFKVLWHSLKDFNVLLKFPQLLNHGAPRFRPGQCDSYTGHSRCRPMCWLLGTHNCPLPGFPFTKGALSTKGGDLPLDKRHQRPTTLPQFGRLQRTSHGIFRSLCCTHIRVKPHLLPSSPSPPPLHVLSPSAPLIKLIYTKLHLRFCFQVMSRKQVQSLSSWPLSETTTSEQVCWLCLLNSEERLWNESWSFENEQFPNRGRKMFPWHIQKGSIILCELWTQSTIFQGKYFMFSITKLSRRPSSYWFALSCLPRKLNCLINSLNLGVSPLQSFTTASLPAHQKLFRSKLFPWAVTMASCTLKSLGL